MFTWNIAKTAEAMFSKFAVKRLCKFLLKKKLGQFLLGEIDIDQLDVQLADGTIQLSDLALNVDFLNEKVFFFLLFANSFLSLFLNGDIENCCFVEKLQEKFGEVKLRTFPGSMLVNSELIICENTNKLGSSRFLVFLETGN